MPILLWPFPTGIAPPPFPILPRAPTGKVVVIHSETKELFGPPPVVNESCALVFYSRAIPLDATPVQFIFTDPNGNTQFGDPSFAFVSKVPISERFPITDIPISSVVYTFGVGELDVVGIWSVMVIAGNSYQTGSASFPVTKINTNIL